MEVSKIENKEESKRNITLKTITTVISILTFFLSILIFLNTVRKDNLVLNKPDNLIVTRTSDSLDEILYSLESKENAHRYSEVRITPILHVYCKHFNGFIVDEEFLYLNKLYIDCVSESESSIIAFKDLPYNGITYDDLFRTKARYYNVKSNDKYIDCDIIYKIDFKYLNNKNEYQEQTIVISRESTAFNLTPKERLLIDQSLKERLLNILKEDEVITLDSIVKIDFQGFEQNCTINPTEELIELIETDCFTFIENFQNKHGIIHYYNTQNESRS